MLRFRADARRSRRSAYRRHALERGHYHIRCIRNSAVSQAEMCAAGLSPDLRGSTCFAQAGGQKSLGQDPALREKRDPEVAKTRKAAASRLRKNSKAPFELISPTEFVERAELKSNASSESQLLLLAMFQVSVSWG